MRTKTAKPRTLISGATFYLEDCKVKCLSPRTIEGKQCSLNAFVNWCISEGLLRPQQIALAEIEAYQAYLYKYRQPYTDKRL
jgi:hypothetical protein